MNEIEVFADVTCPFTHVGLRRIIHEREQLGRATPRLRVRAWPLELVNRQPFDPGAMADKCAALREQVAPELFSNVNPTTWPSTSLPALSLIHAAYRTSTEMGERAGLEVREALFERGRDISDEAELATIARHLGIAGTNDDDVTSIEADWAEGQERGVIGSPHFFFGDDHVFCPTLDITHPDGELRIRIDEPALAAFLAQIFG